MSVECLCVKRVSRSVKGEGAVLKAFANAWPAQLRGPIAAKATLKADLIREKTVSADMKAEADLAEGLTANYRVKESLDGKGILSKSIGVSKGVFGRIKASGVVLPGYTDKFAGDFSALGCKAGDRLTPSGYSPFKVDYNSTCSGIQKLYPSGDHTPGLFVNQGNTTTNTYLSIDEGVFDGNYHENLKHSDRYSDDISTFIHPSSIYTDGTFSYKCFVDAPRVTPVDSKIYFRAAAPWDTEKTTSPRYTIQNIKFEDPSGNLIVQYGDIQLYGDCDYEDPSHPTYYNYSTYGSAAIKSNLGKKQWEHGYPFMEEDNGYTLSFDLFAECLDKPFDVGFDFGFESGCLHEMSGIQGNNDYLALDGSPLSTRIQDGTNNPTNSIRISAIEIANSGYFDTHKELYLGMHLQVTPTGNRLLRCFPPTDMRPWDFDTGIYPLSSSIWHDNASLHSNQTTSGIAKLVSNITNDSKTEYITMASTASPVPNIQDSGKLVLKFGTTVPGAYFAYKNGEFGFGFASGAYPVAELVKEQPIDNFFTVDSVYLKVNAKKATGTRDYALDVVGFSDDRLLNVTSAVGGFLQNASGYGTIPTFSGYNPTDEFGISAESISDQDQFYSKDTTNNDGGDHYQLPSTIVNSTTFTDYEVPLKVYKDPVEIGTKTDFKSSSFFENIYLDIYPLPTGAAISKIELCVKYKPTNALNVHTIGSEKIGKIDSTRPEAKFYPTTRQTGDDIINAGSGYGALSTISNIPHGYKTPETIKSNYSRRWRGHIGLVNGPFDPDEFGFGFENPTLYSPFMSGFFDFDNQAGSTTITPSVGTLTGTLHNVAFGSAYLNNHGWRFTASDIFSQQLASHTTAYQTTDWTSLANGADDFSDHELYGNIADAFNTVVRTSGANSHINFGDVEVEPAKGFSAYIRFTPDITVSGTNYNQFSSGILFSKFISTTVPEFALGWSNGYLCGFASTAGGEIITAKDTIDYSNYQYPLSVVLTYNDKGSKKLRLYTDNEIASGDWTTHRASSHEFVMATGTGNLLLGHTAGTGVGMDMFVSEFGLSDSGNVVYSSPDLTHKQTTAEEFLENNRVKFWASGEQPENDRYKLWDRVNQDTTKWDLGAFKYCEFDSSFDWWTTRVGRDLLSFNISNSGDPYINKVSNSFTMPSNIDSGVSYHSQIENDFLRFNLSQAAENFHSIGPRITKSVPRGYKFSERALVVETVLEHRTTNDIEWNDGSRGPKLVVSLYTKNKDHRFDPNKTNWGLVNRVSHYLKPSGCVHKIYTNFDYDSLFDTSEAWATFSDNSERKLSEFNHRYYSEDINDMFLQYDVVYPSGGKYDSTIDIHSAHVTTDDAYVSAHPTSGLMTLTMSGVKQRQDGFVRLFNVSHSGLVNSVNLHSFSQPPVANSGMMVLSASGSPDNVLTKLGLHSFTSKTIASGMNLFANVSDISGQFSTMSLHAHNVQSLGDSGALLTLNVHAGGIGGGAFGYLPMTMFTPDKNVQSGPASGAMIFHARGMGEREDPRVSSNINMFIFSEDSPYRNASMNLVLSHPEPVNTSSGLMGLFTINHPYVRSHSFQWHGRNFGSAITVNDESYTTVAANDEIRGVDLIAFGDCDKAGATENEIIQDGVTYHGEKCIDAGITRAKDTYTNDLYSYSGNYYGIRKITGLQPNTAYEVTLKGKTGTDKKIELPKEWEEWEYGSIGDINFSGHKIVGDYPNLLPNGRNEGDKYGATTAVNKDLLAVSAPKHAYDEAGSGYLKDAGAVYLYRKNQLATSGDKGFWSLETKLVLPSGYRKSYPESGVSKIKVNNLPDIHVRNWQVGQQGREFGHSVDLAITENKNSLIDKTREIAVVGAPNASWSGIFGDITTSGVPVGIMLVTDEFKTPKRTQLQTITSIINQQNHLWKFYADPPVHLDLKVIIIQPTNGAFGNIESHGELPSWMVHRKIEVNNVNKTNSLEMYSGIKSAFEEAFPYDGTKTHSGIPPLLGLFVDPSRTLGRKKVEPAIDQFIGHYKDLGFLSGVKTLGGSGLQASGHFYEYFRPVSSEDQAAERTQADVEDWVQMGSELLTNSNGSGLLDTGRLVKDDGVTLITTSLGEPSESVLLSSGLQVPPASGGRVYVFEKESGVWGLIQEIKSPGEYQFHVPDRFGHSVAISENAEILSIGSPYMSEACSIFEHRPAERESMFKLVRGWLADNAKTSELSQYEIYNAQYGWRKASEMIYYELNTTDRFKFRKDSNVNEYQQIYRFGYDDIPYRGTWGFILTGVEGRSGEAPTSRMGWSTAVNEDGSVVAFGAPTDSLNEADDTNVYYKDQEGTGYSTVWASETNAGAVRLFGSRQYHPHGSVVEYFKFGNLDMSTHSGTPENYTFLKDTYQTHGVPFSRTPYAELEIPKDAGTAFIVTPEIDATSDEILQNIKDWLALGDRTLVLVGNDPVWEENGKYKLSNDIINKILEKLGSEMRLSAARTQYESLSGCPETGKPNVLRSADIPYTRNTDIVRDEIFAHGVGDIRMHVPGWETLYPPCTSVGKSEHGSNCCDMPLAHSGDLRAGWKEECIDDAGRLKTENYYWPFHYGNGSAQCEVPPLSGILQRPNNEPKPLLVAGEYKTPDPIVIPAWTEKVVKRVCVPISGFVTKTDKTYHFEDTHFSQTAFAYSDDGQISNMTITDQGAWKDPKPFNGRDAVLQAFGSSKDEVIKREKRVYPNSYLAAEENWIEEATSKVVIISSVASESEKNMGHDQDRSTDGNTNFYYNLVEKLEDGEYDCGKNKGLIAQLGGWTNRSSFKDAFDKSVLKLAFESDGHGVVENVSTLDSDGESVELPRQAHVCWVANPNGTPSESEVARMKEWLNRGDKTLVITLDNDQAIARNVFEICNKLGTDIKPLLIHTTQNGETEGIDKWAQKDVDMDGGSNDQSMNADLYIVKGCEGENNESKFFAISRTSDENANQGWIQDEDRTIADFVVLNIGDRGRQLIKYDVPIKSVLFETESLWQIKSGVFAMTADVQAASGYRVFVDFARELQTEKQEIRWYGKGFEFDPDHRNDKNKLEPGKGLLGITDYKENDEGYSYAEGLMFASGLLAPEVGKTGTSTIDIRIPSGISKINLYFEANNLRVLPTTDYIPRTFRILSASGALLPIEERTHLTHKKVHLRDECTETVSYIEHPAITTTFPERLRPIKTDNSKYCIEPAVATESSVADLESQGFSQQEIIEMKIMEELNNEANADIIQSGIDTTQQLLSDTKGQLIADGPVVVAEEPEKFSAFAAGKKRSRIVLISDASILQGTCPEYRTENSANAQFIKSLYDKSSSMSKLRDSNTTIMDLDGGNLGSEYSGTTRGDGATRRILQNLEGGRQFEHIQKVISPERGSPQKFWAASGMAGLASKFGGGTARVSGSYFDSSDRDPKTVTRVPEPETLPLKKKEMSKFLALAAEAGANAKFHETVGSVVYRDRDAAGGMPPIVEALGRDHIDFDAYPSGYPGDLFGYSIALEGDRLIVGSPFNGFDSSNVIYWPEVSGFNKNNLTDISGISVGGNGGAGAVFAFMRTGSGINVFGSGVPWQFVQKLKPSGANEPIDGYTNITNSENYIGSNNYTAADLEKMMAVGDMFGYSVSMDSDFLAIGAPGHDFTNYHEHVYDSGSFLRKEFNFEFDIPLHNVYDLGDSGTRTDIIGSGTPVLNNGAVFTYRYGIVNWGNRTKEYIEADKVVAQGYNDRKQKDYTDESSPVAISGSENDNFGRSVHITRSDRADADYTLSVGAPHHMFASGNVNDVNPLPNAGAAYTYDAMLREQPATSGSKQATLFANVYGDGSGTYKVRLEINQAVNAANTTYQAEGMVFSNNEGELFLETSGQDPAVKGFIEHRPYVLSAEGEIPSGTPVFNFVPLTTEGSGVSVSGAMNLYILPQSQATVYNNIGLYTQSAYMVTESGMPLFVSGVSATAGSGSMILAVSGIQQLTSQLNLRVRGK